MGIGDTGISSSYKVPRYIAKIVFGAGSVSAGSGRLKCLVVGMKTDPARVVVLARVKPHVGIRDLGVVPGFPVPAGETITQVLPALAAAQAG